jgi:hypothetical protein
MKSTPRLPSRASLARASLLALPLALALGAGCGPGPQVTYVGIVNGTDAVVAVTAWNKIYEVFVSGGPTTVGTLSHWFTGPELANGQSVIAADGYTVDVTARGDVAQGLLTTPDGHQYVLSMDRVQANTIAGLYAVDDGGCRTGVVVTQDTASDTPQVQGTWCALSGDERFAPVNAAGPVALTDGGIAVQANLASGPRPLTVHPDLLSAAP